MKAFFAQPVEARGVIMSECIFCGIKRPKGRKELIKIHLECFLEYTQSSDSIKAVLDFMSSYRPKNESDYPTIEAYLKSVESFRDRMKKVNALQASLG